MIIIPDSNIFYNDWALERTTVRVLFQFASRAGFEIILPEIVVLELVNQVKEEIAAVADANNRRLQDLTRKTGVYASPLIFQPSVDRHTKEFEEKLRAKLASFDVKISDIPNPPHTAVVSRDLSRTKPFSKSGKGYRDFLIWWNVLETAEDRDERVIFLTANTKDFANETKSRLHEDLLSDLKDRNLDSSKVTLVNSLLAFVKEHLLPCLPSPEQTLISFMQKAHSTFSLQSELADALTEYLTGEEIDPEMVGKSEEYESVAFSMVETVYNLEVVDEHETAPSERLIDLEACLECEFDAFIFKADLYSMSEDETPHVSNHDWNDHYAAVSFVASVLAQVTITLEIADAEISSVEVLSISSAPSQTAPSRG